MYNASIVFTCVFGMQKISVLFGVLLQNCVPSTESLFSTCTCAIACCASHSTFAVYSSLVRVVLMCLEFCSVLKTCLYCHHMRRNRLHFVVRKVKVQSAVK